MHALKREIQCTRYDKALYGAQIRPTNIHHPWQAGYLFVCSFISLGLADICDCWHSSSFNGANYVMSATCLCHPRWSEVCGFIYQYVFCPVICALVHRHS